MKGWLDNCSADGGGDTPEAVADALHDILKLSWRQDATKICVCISDAPPHGLGCEDDGFPNGCPVGIDPMTVAHQLAQKGITIYMVGCEPSISPYKEFFMAVAYITGGQYVPLTKAQLLTKVIIGGAYEEISLEQFMSKVDEAVQAEVAAGREIDEDAFAERVHAKLKSKGIRTKQLHRNEASLETVNASPVAKKLSNLKSMSEVRTNYTPEDAPSPRRLMKSKKSKGAPRAQMACMEEYEPFPAMAPPLGDDYNTVEDEITYEQSSRMVQKSIARNFAKKK